MLSRNHDGRDRTHWLDERGQPACWNAHQECAEHKVAVLTAANTALSERLAALTAALEWRDLQREKVGCYVCGHQGRPYATTIYWDDQGRPHGFWTCSEEHRLQMVRERNPYLAAHPAAGQPAPAAAEGE